MAARFLLPPDIAGIEALRDIVDAESDPGVQHARVLRNAHHEVSHRLDVAASRALIAFCHQLVAQRVPCRRENMEHYAGHVLIAYPWPAALVDETTTLLRAYCRAGYVRMNDQVDAFGSTDGNTVFCAGRTPLEVAIRLGRLPAIVPLIEEGDRTDLAPRYDGVQHYTDMFQLAEVHLGELAPLPEMRAAMMRRRIQVMAASAAAQSPAPERRRARAEV